MNMGSENSMGKVVMTIMTLLIGSIIVMSIFIPFVLDTVNEHDPDVTVDSGGTWSYTVQTDVPSTFSISGVPEQYVQWNGNTVTIQAPDGYYRVVIKVVSGNPPETTEEEFLIRFGDKSMFEDISPLLLILPVMVIIGLIIFALRGMGVSGKIGGSDPYDYDNY